MYAGQLCGPQGRYRMRHDWCHEKDAPVLQTWYDGMEVFFNTIPIDLEKTEYERLTDAIWPDKLSGDDQDWFVDVLARKTKDGGDYIYLRDVKELTLFNVLNDICPSFLEFYWTESVDKLLRALIVYFQYFMQVWDVVQYRTKHSETLVRHSRSKMREDKWRKSLNDLRYIVAREYCSIVNGFGDSTKFHHMGATRGSKSAPRMDNLHYELLYKYSRRVVELVLGEKQNPVIYDEINRLFRTETNPFRIKGLRDKFSVIDRQCLEDPFKHQITPMEAPIVQELYRFNRDPVFAKMGRWSEEPLQTDNDQMKILHMMYVCSEEYLVENNIKVGILGQPRSHFDLLLNWSDQTRRTLCFMEPEILPFGENFDPVSLKETITPAVVEGKPQKFDLPPRSKCYSYNRKEVSDRWKEFLKVFDRFPGSRIRYKKEDSETNLRNILNETW